LEIGCIVDQNSSVLRLLIFSQSKQVEHEPALTFIFCAHGMRVKAQGRKKKRKSVVGSVLGFLIISFWFC
jgi:hypothetical protein